MLDNLVSAGLLNGGFGYKFMIFPLMKAYLFIFLFNLQFLVKAFILSLRIYLLVFV